MNRKKIILLVSTTTAMALLSGCAGLFGSGDSANSSAQSVGSSSSSSNGSEFAYSTAVPTTEAIVARIELALEKNVSVLNGNFKTAYGLVSSSLPRVADATKVSGTQQIPVLVHAACQDLAATQANATKYGITLTTGLAANRNALIAAGVRIANNATHLILDQAPAAKLQVTQVITAQVDANAGIAAATVKDSFAHVCLAAASLGATGVGGY